MDITTPYGGDANAPTHTLDEFLYLLDHEPGFAKYPWIVFDSPPVIGGLQLRQLIRRFGRDYSGHSRRADGISCGADGVAARQIGPGRRQIGHTEGISAHAPPQ